MRRCAMTLALCAAVTLCGACSAGSDEGDGALDVGRDVTSAPDVPGQPDAEPAPDVAGDTGGGGDVWRSDPLSCSSCHGDDDSPAPPRSAVGETDRSFRGVGAHRAHLGESDWHRAGVCEDCHVMPSETRSPGHIDDGLPAELVWGPAAALGGAAPTWDGTSCSSVYCHGATLDAGGTLIAPRWTRSDGAAGSCGACHGAPPPEPHPQASACADCHPTMDASGTFVAPALHIDGVVQVSGGGGPHPDGYAAPGQHGAEFTSSGPSACTGCHGDQLTGGAPTGLSGGGSCETCHPTWKTTCTFCHGGTDNGTGAPPESIAGETATSFLAVGAHTAHVAASDIHAQWSCDRCHTVPGSALADGHIDGDGRAEVAFDGLNPDGAYDPSTGTCSSSYCHGGTMEAGGSLPTPTWTGESVGCTSCHAMPPAAPHPAGSDCATCHGEVVAANLGFVAKDLHIDGQVQANAGGPHPDGYASPSQHGADFTSSGPSACTGCHGAQLTGGDSTGSSAGGSCDACHAGWKTTCTFCHGGSDNGTGAPPESIADETARSFLGVGAHTAHVSPSGTHAQWSCDTCHSLPRSAMADGHIDGDGRAEVDFSGVNASGAYDPNTGTCSSSYCHGNGRFTGSAQWTSTTSLSCESCHPSWALDGEHEEHHHSCSTCHAGTVDSGGGFVDAELHVNGTVDVEFSRGGTWNPSTGRCSSTRCHGGSPEWW